MPGKWCEAPAVDLSFVAAVTVSIERVAVLRNQPSGSDMRFWEIECLTDFRRFDVSLLTFQHCGFENGEGFDGHGLLS